MGKIFKAKVLAFDQEEQNRQNEVRQRPGPIVGQMIIIKFVKKKDDMNSIELDILKFIKSHPGSPNRFANLYDSWEQ